MPPSGSEKTTSLSQILNIVGTHFIKSVFSLSDLFKRKKKHMEKFLHLDNILLCHSERTV